MSDSRNELMRKIQELCFACLDMNLYLDNNPCDKNAITTFNSLCNQFLEARCLYENKYGPLTNFGFSPSKYPFRWVESPWPWEREFND